MQSPIKLVIPFEALVEAIANLDMSDKIRLRQILDQHIDNPEEKLDTFLAERGCHPPFKEGLPLTSEPARSGYNNISIEHDPAIVQQHKADQ